MLKKLIHLIDPSSRPNQTCESCNGSFHCGASIKGCWCTTIKLTAEARAEMRQLYNACLCEDCLKGFAASQSGEVVTETHER
jgi:hypothetical protein